MLTMYCIFNGVFVLSVDSGMFYFCQVPLTLVLFYAVQTPPAARRTAPPTLKPIQVVRMHRSRSARDEAST